ncbi:MAG: hypothetical protein JWM16_566 [Verrucomicrobiales bacterium]|nr:hypothetical protein [Verrucomicrobiales bacterium]
MRAMIVMVLLVACMGFAGCEKHEPVATAAVAVALTATKQWEYKMFDPSYLRFQPGLVEQKDYFVNGGVIVNAEQLANRMGELGWELMSDHPAGEIAFKREKGQGKETIVRLVGKNHRYE